jgi:hypothetical protein
MDEPMEFYDEKGALHVMAACGHYVSGSVKPGMKIAVCPNCRFAGMFKDILVVYPGQLPVPQDLYG